MLPGQDVERSVAQWLLQTVKCETRNGIIFLKSFLIQLIEKDYSVRSVFKSGMAILFIIERERERKIIPFRSRAGKLLSAKCETRNGIIFLKSF